MSFREQLLAAVAPPSGPDRLDPVVRTVTEEAAFTRSLVEYTVADGHRNEAYLLVPHDVEPPAPGVLAIHQHAGRFYVGKSEPAGVSANEEYHYGKELAERGFVVLCPDLLCFESRRPPEFRREEGTSPDGRAYEKFEAMRYLLAGSTLQGKYLADLTAGLDYLADHELVDGERLGVIGHSLGGQESIWLAWYDDRVRATVASCGMSRYEAIIRDEINHNYAAYVPGLLELGEIDDVLAGIAPRPLFLANGDQDRIFPSDAVREVFAGLEDEYAAADAADRFTGVIVDGAHGFPAAIRSEAYAFLDGFLR